MTKKTLPLLPLRDIVVFPHMMVPLYVGRAKSIQAVDEAMKEGRQLVLAAQKKAKTNEPKAEDICEIGTIGIVMQHIKRPDGTVKILIEGQNRVRIKEFLPGDKFYHVEVEDYPQKETKISEAKALKRTIHEVFEHYARISRRLQPDVVNSINQIDDAQRLAYTVVAHLPLKHADKQMVLEMNGTEKQLEKLCELIQAETEILQVERKIRSRVKKQMERTEKEYYLNEQMRAIQKELGDRDDIKSELSEIEDKIAEKSLSDEARERLLKEIKKLKMMSPMSAEATVVRNYIDWCLALPWEEITETKLEIEEAEEILEADHHGLKKPKERILEYLAVQKLVDKVKGPILCLVGPPGVGKTSLGKSIARATNRKFVRLSLGGVRDEAEIRGHRRTYIGAMPGKVIQSLKKAGSNNPVFLLDEVDKMSSDFRGDPSSALLEVLDPEQNNTFNDHYLDLDYDLSQIMFVCTANNIQGIPLALMDRMEIIRLSGYTELEKLCIAKEYLIPKQISENGLNADKIKWNEGATSKIIQNYTREAGVRTLEREISSVCRKIAREVVKSKEEKSYTITPKRIREYLGIEKHRTQKKENDAQIGMATGLAWTSMGGEVLQVEVTTMPGKGKLHVTGKLGEVMQESAQAAMSYVRSRSKTWGLDDEFYSSLDVHIHVPEGAMPKDGPSAGITIASALVSAFTKIPIKNNVAMTGEITLRGRVLPIGGLKEKSLAAHRAEIFDVIIPSENEKDLEDIPKSIAKVMNYHIVKHMDEVITHALDLDNPSDYFAKLADNAESDDVQAEADKKAEEEKGESHHVH
ncbi:MAG: endopeptidase La [Myxococcales bacterium]|nr:endopeptidase La [Myxococcales bacterium]